MPATLVVTSFPSGATVRAGKTIVGSTPIQGYRLGPGTYQVTLMKGGFVPWTRKLTLNAGRIHAVTATLTAVPATLRVVVLHQGKTTWATVSINGEAVGDTHAVKRRVSPGTYRITAFRRGYRRAHREVDLAPGSARMVQIVLEKE